MEERLVKFSFCTEIIDFIKENFSEGRDQATMQLLLRVTAYDLN